MDCRSYRRCRSKDFRFNKVAYGQGKHLDLAWGQIGISDFAVDKPILDSLVTRLQLANPETSPCFPINDKADSQSCLLNIVSSFPSASELGDLLQHPYTDFRKWQSFVKSLQLPGAEIVALESQLATDSGSAAGNLLWLFQSLGRTYSRTRELLEAFLPIPSGLTFL